MSESTLLWIGGVVFTILFTVVGAYIGDIKSEIKSLRARVHKLESLSHAEEVLKEIRQIRAKM